MVIDIEFLFLIIIFRKKKTHNFTSDLIDDAICSCETRPDQTRLLCNAIITFTDRYLRMVVLNGDRVDGGVSDGGNGSDGSDGDNGSYGGHGDGGNGSDGR